MSAAVNRTVILGAARTPFGRLLGGLAPLSAVELGTVAARGAIDRAGIPADEIGYCVFGTVIQAGQGHIPSRQVSLAAGLREDVGSDTVNKVCASGMRAIALADALIRLGEYDTVLAGGMESMTNAPYLAQGARKGYRFGDAALDRLDDLGRAARPVERPADVRAGVGRRRRAAASTAPISTPGRRARTSARSRPSTAAGSPRRSCPSSIPGRKGDTVVDTDEGPRRDTSLEALAALKPLVAGRHAHGGQLAGRQRRRGRGGRRLGGRGGAPRPEAARDHPLRRAATATATTRWRACRRWRRRSRSRRPA